MAKTSRSDRDGDQDSPNGEASGFPPHPLLTRLAEASIDPGDTIVVSGYLAPSESTELARIYLDLSFRSYLTLPAEAIVHVEEADPADEWKPSRIILMTDARITFSESIDSAFLRGAIASGQPLRSALAGGVAGFADTIVCLSRPGSPPGTTASGGPHPVTTPPKTIL